jgi:hypothetical protein
MVDLWGLSTTYGRDFHASHIAFAVSLSDLLKSRCGFAAVGNPKIFVSLVEWGDKSSPNRVEV